MNPLTAAQRGVFKILPLCGVQVSNQLQAFDFHRVRLVACVPPRKYRTIWWKAEAPEQRNKG
jgi:hypothetical protein